jgi:tetratricopeptide (TPR) repeat protein
MKLHHLFALSAGVAAIVAALPASAAVKVVGNSQAATCYQIADRGSNTVDGISICSDALQDETLSTHDRASTYVNRGALRARLHDLEGALNDYNQSLAIQPDLAEAYVDRGAALLGLKRYRESLASFDQGIALGPVRNLEVVYYDRGIAHESIGEYRAAYEDYRKSVELAPGFSLAKEQLGRFRVVRKPAASGI